MPTAFLINATLASRCYATFLHFQRDAYEVRLAAVSMAQFAITPHAHEGRGRYTPFFGCVLAGILLGQTERILLPSQFLSELKIFPYAYPESLWKIKYDQMCRFWTFPRSTSSSLGFMRLYVGSHGAGCSHRPVSGFFQASTSRAL